MYPSATKVIEAALLVVLCGTLPPLLSATAFGQTLSSELLLARAERAVDRPLPTLSDLLGAEPSAPPAPVIAIGYLDNGKPGGDDDWGRAVGQFLMEAAYDGYRELAVVPPYQYASDGRTDSDDRRMNRHEQLSRVANRTGARFGLTGTISVRDDRFDLNLELFEYPGGGRLAMRRTNGALASLSLAVQELGQDLLRAAVSVTSPTAVPSPGAIAAPGVGELEALAVTFGKAQELSGDKRLAVYESLWRQHPQFKSTGTLYLGELGNERDPAKVRAKLSDILTRGARTLAAETYGHLLQVQYAPGAADPEARSKLAELLRSDPNSLGAWLALSNAYVSEQVMYRDDDRGLTYVISAAIDHHPGYASAISLGLETVRRWPNYYRAWWGLSYSLQAYAGLVRGTGFWRDIPESQRNRFREIVAVADDCLAEAIRRHPAQGALYTNMISIDAQMGRDWSSSFRRAADLDPHARLNYQTAFNFARPQWGGNRDDLREIYQLAKRNNPGADWPRQLRNGWAPEIKPLVDLEEPWIRYGLVVLFLALLYAAWRYWRQDR